MNISIFGLGYVGAVTAACLAKDGHAVIGVDPDQRKLDFIRTGKSPILEEYVEELISGVVETGRLRVTADCTDAVRKTSISLICVGTPSAPDGALGTEFITKVCAEIGDAIRNKKSRHTVVVRSTVAPGTTLNLLRPILEEHSGGAMGTTFGLAMNPEFLREGTAVKDFYAPPFTVVGTDCPHVFKQVCELYDQSGGEAVHCSVPVAESIKYACNLFHATKITFANEIGMVCQSCGVDSREVLRIVCRDTKLNISARYLAPGFAFGGSCLPKDLRAFSHVGRTRNRTADMFEAILRSNRNQIETVAQRIMDFELRRVSIMGISFKQGSDDLRESPLVSLAEILIGKGFDVAIFDPNVEYASLFGSNKRYIEVHLPHLKRALVSSEVALKHAQVVVFGHRSDDYAHLPARIRPDQIVFDLAGVCHPKDVQGRYEGLYW